MAYTFDVVASKVNQIAPNKRFYFGKALLGIEDLNFIEHWLQENIDILSDKAELLDILDCIWEVVKELIPDNRLLKLLGNGANLFMTKLWSSGVSYYEIMEQAKQDKIQYKHGKKERELTIENVIDICDSSLSYDAMLIVGACADLLENIFDKPDVTELVRCLQVSLKVGLINKLAVSLYHHGLTDRIVATEVQNSLIAYDSNLNTIDKNSLKSHLHIIEPVLSQLPSAFSNILYRHS